MGASEGLGEGTFMQHREPATSLVDTASAGFVEAGEALSDCTPYVRCELYGDGKPL